MVDTTTVQLTAGDWVTLGNDAAFLCQNTTPIEIYIKAAAVKPTSLVGAKILYPGNTANKITSGVHWAYARFGVKLSYTQDDR
jgi:hypothetical protein